MPRRSSRSRPCSLTSCNEPDGSATRAVATALLSNDGSSRNGNGRLPLRRGQGCRLAEGGAPQRARTLDGVLPRLRRRAPVVPRLRVGGARAVLVRRPHPPPLPSLRRALLVDLRRRLRG